MKSGPCFLLLLLMLQTGLTDGASLRLAGSNSSCSGRVEVFNSGQWGTVCDNEWDIYDAQVVCRQLGCGRAVSATASTKFGQGTVPIFMDNVNCIGNERYLIDCAYPKSQHNCGHAEDAGVVCEENFLVRLAGSDNSCSGRVEVFYSGRWGTVCDDNWDLNDAHAVCRQVGCGNATSVSTFAPRNGQIWMNNVTCFGNETYLAACGHNGLGTHNCSHQEDAGVVCEGADPQSEAPTNPVRLVDGNSTCSGRVEVFYSGQWTTVCSDHWDMIDAHVVCRQVGCGNAVSATRHAHSAEGSGQTWVNDVHCLGNESQLAECSQDGFGAHNCRHHEDAGVVCEAHYLHLSSASLVCSRDQMEVGVRLDSLQSAGLSAQTGHLSVPLCSSHRVSGLFVWYQAPRQSGLCGNVLRTNETHAVYQNALFLYPQSTDSFALPEIIPFSCAYPIRTNIILNSQPSQQRLLLNNGGLSGIGAEPTAYVNLYRDSDFSHTYSQGPVRLTVGSALHMEVSVNETDPSFKLVLDSCYTSPSSNPDSPSQYYLINSRCPVDRRHVSVIESGQSLRARFSALLFPVESDDQFVYLHCRVSLCDRLTNCVPNCAGRSKRSLHKASTLKLDTVTAGPIYWNK